MVDRTDRPGKKVGVTKTLSACLGDIVNADGDVNVGDGIDWGSENLFHSNSTILTIFHEVRPARTDMFSTCRTYIKFKGFGREALLAHVHAYKDWLSGTIPDLADRLDEIWETRMR